MIRLIKIISTSIDSLSRRLVKFQGNGKDDIQEVINISQFGDDSNPIKDMVAVKVDTAIMGESVVIGYINTNQLAAVGEKRLFSTDESGNEQMFLWLKNDGTIEFGGNAGHLTRYEELKTAFDELKNNFNSFVNTTYNVHIHPTPAGPSSPTVSLGTPSTADMSGAKINELKTL